MSACIRERRKEDEVTVKVRKKTRGMERMCVGRGGACKLAFFNEKIIKFKGNGAVSAVFCSVLTPGCSVLSRRCFVYIYINIYILMKRQYLGT